MVRGWREGFNLGSEIPNIDHMVKESHRTETEKEIIGKSLAKEKDLGRIHGPIDFPYRDGKWFKHHWVSPYFVIPKKTPIGCPQKYRLIHHLSYHNSHERDLSFNGYIDIDEYPTYFPTYPTGAHLVF